MTTVKQIQARSTPDQIAAGVKWERVKIHHGVLVQEFDQSIINDSFVMLVRDDGAWSIHEHDPMTVEPGCVIVQGESPDADAARRDATLALLGACEAAHYFLFENRLHDIMAQIALRAACDATAQIMRDSAINPTDEG